MDAETEAPQTTVPVKVSQPEDHAPPTLAEPASGVVAEMSGALPADHEHKDEAKPAESNGVHHMSSPPDLFLLMLTYRHCYSKWNRRVHL